MIGQAKYFRAIRCLINTDAFEHGRRLAARAGLGECVRFVQSDVRHIKQLLDHPPDLVKMLGICEYLTNEQIVEVAGAAAEVMPTGAGIVFNSLSKAHGNDRFFRRVFGLHMTHRSPHRLQALMRQAGFSDFNSIPEPLGVYHVIVGRRKAKGPRSSAKGP